MKIRLSFVMHEYSHAVLEIPDDLVAKVSRENIESEMWAFGELAQGGHVQWVDDPDETAGEVWDVELDPVGVDDDPVTPLTLDDLESIGFTTEGFDD